MQAEFKPPKQEKPKLHDHPPFHNLWAVIMQFLRAGQTETA